MLHLYRPKRRRVGSGLLVRYREGTCAFRCYQCPTWFDGRGWRAMLHRARAHAHKHASGHLRKVNTSERYTIRPAGRNYLDRAGGGR